MKNIFVLILASALTLYGCSNSGDSAYFPPASPAAPAPETTTPINTGTQETGNGTGNEQPQETNQPENPNSSGEEPNSQGTGNGQPQETNQPETPNSGGEETQTQTPKEETTSYTQLYTKVIFKVDDGNNKYSYSTDAYPWSTQETVNIKYERELPVSSKTVPNRTVTKENIVEYKDYKVRPNDVTTVRIPYKKQITTETYKVSYKFAGWKLPDGTIFGKENPNEWYNFKSGSITEVVAQFEEYEEKVSETTETWARTVIDPNTLVTVDATNAITYQELCEFCKIEFKATSSAILDENHRLFTFEPGETEETFLFHIGSTNQSEYYATWEKQ